MGASAAVSNAAITITVAPLVLNSLFAAIALALATRLYPPVAFLPLWIGLACGLTALPSHADTASLLPGVRTLSPAVRPLGYALAIPVRAISYSVVVGGLLALAWTGVLLTLVRPV